MNLVDYSSLETALCFSPVSQDLKTEVAVDTGFTKVDC